jgi:hypothetical protein
MKDFSRSCGCRRVSVTGTFAQRARGLSRWNSRLPSASRRLPDDVDSPTLSGDYRPVGPATRFLDRNDRSCRRTLPFIPALAGQSGVVILSDHRRFQLTSNPPPS